MTRKNPYRPTFLNITSVVYIAGCICYTIINYHELAAEEGWGVVAMIGLAGVGLLALLVDAILQQLIRDRVIETIVGILIAIIAAVWIIRG